MTQAWRYVVQVGAGEAEELTISEMLARWPGLSRPVLVSRLRREVGLVGGIFDAAVLGAPVRAYRKVGAFDEAWLMARAAQTDARAADLSETPRAKIRVKASVRERQLAYIGAERKAGR